MGVDEAYIYHYAQYIYDPQDTAGGSRSGWAGSKLVGSCALLASKAKSVGGLLWDRSGSCLGSLSANRISGFPCNFGLRRDGNLQGAIMYGLLFVRDTTAGGRLRPTDGGGATLVMHSTGTIYGSAIVQGTARANGTSAIVYNGTVMQTLLNLDSNYGAAPVPGSWTDRYAY